MTERAIGAPTISRGRRCANCRHYDNGPAAIQHYKVKRYADMQRMAAEILEGKRAGDAGRRGDDDRDLVEIARQAGSLKTRGFGEREALKIASEVAAKPRRRFTDSGFGDMDELMRGLGVNYELGDKLMRQGVLGMCRVQACPGDFVHRDYFCGTKYDAAVTVDGAEVPDETAEEARSRLGLD